MSNPINSIANGNGVASMENLKLFNGIRRPNQQDGSAQSAVGGNDIAAMLMQQLRAPAQSLQGGKDGMNAQGASGAIGAFMRSNDLSKIDMNDIYKMSQGQLDGKNVPKTVQEAARFMMDNPDAFKQIETNDVKNQVDGKSAGANFDQAAQGNIASLSAGDAKVGASALPATEPQSAVPTQQASVAPQSAADTPGMPDPKGKAEGLNAQEASGAIGAFMHSNDISKIDMNDIYKMSQGQLDGKEVPKAVQDAARFMMDNPDTFKKIETNDVKNQVDGKSAAANFDQAAQGNIKGLEQSSGKDADPQVQRMLSAIPSYAKMDGNIEQLKSDFGSSSITEALQAVRQPLQQVSAQDDHE